MSSPLPGSLARNRRGVTSVIFFVMSAAAPLAVVAGVVTIGYAATGLVGIPAGFVAMAIVLGLFSVGYVSMSRHISNAGAFYAYVARGLGRPWGVGAAWMALVAYNALQIGLYGMIGAAVGPLAQQWFGLHTQWWEIAGVAWALVAFLGVRRVELSGRVLAPLITAEIAVILVYDVAFVTHPAAGVSPVGALGPATMIAGGLTGFGAVLVLAFLGFTGVESAVVFAEESRHPRRTVPAATYTALTVIGVAYAVSAWAMAVTAGPGAIAGAATAAGPRLLFDLAGRHLPAVLVQVGSALFATSALAAALSFHNTVARYTFALGRERVFPALLSATGRRSGAPISASITQSALALVVVGVYALVGLNPIYQLMFWMGGAGSFGLLTLLLITSIAVVAFFARDAHGENWWRRLVAPSIAAVLLAGVVGLAVPGLRSLLSAPPSVSNADGINAGARMLWWAIPLTYLIVGVCGVGWAFLLRHRRPAVYATIGLGANSVTGVATPRRVTPAIYPQAVGGGSPERALPRARG